MTETPFRRALRRRRERFATWPTIGTIVLALSAMLLGLALPILLYRVVQLLVETWTRIDWHPLGQPRDVDSAIDVIAGLIGYAALASVALWRLPQLGGASLGDLGLRALRGGDIAAIAILIAINAGIGFVLRAYYRLLHASNHVQAGFEHFAIRTPLAVLICASMIVIGPFAEELVFRGIIFNALALRTGTATGALGSGLLFGLTHGDPILLPFLALQGTLWRLPITGRATCGCRSARTLSIISPRFSP